MHLLTIATSAVALFIGAAALSLPAGAEQTGNLSACVKLAGKVNQALADAEAMRLPKALVQPQ